MDWLTDERAAIIGEELVNRWEAYVIDVDFSFGRVARFYLGKELSYALIKYEYVKNDDILTETMVEEFEEVVPGLWFPVVTTMRSHHSLPGLDDKESRFEVLDFQINAPVLDSFFEVKFEADIAVEDRR